MGKVRFIIQPSTHQSGCWLCTDTKNNIVCEWTEHKFNETQKFTFLDDVINPNPLAIAKMMREMADFLSENHIDLIF